MLGDIVLQRIAAFIRLTHCLLAYASVRDRSTQSNRFGEASDRQKVEIDRVLPQSDRHTETVARQYFVHLQSDSVRLAFDSICSVDEAIDPLSQTVS
jgi:hypothetical protein